MKHSAHLSRLGNKLIRLLAPSFWFLTGFLIAALTLVSLIILYFQHSYNAKVIPGIFVEDTYIGEKTEQQVADIFNNRNEKMQKVQFELTYNDQTATISAKELNIGFDTNLITDQALAYGKSPNIVSDIFVIIDAYLNGASINPSYTFDQDKIKDKLISFDKEIYQEPVDALFTVENNRVTAFKESSNGQAIDYEKLNTIFIQKVKEIVSGKSPQIITLQLPIKILKPTVSTEKANNLGIVEQIGQGVSYFAGSIPNRVHNISLAASRINGVLVAPGEVFSFDKSLGDVDKYNGYKEAYVIQNGKTVLGDGGGVCQVSTTLFRAVLNSGLPVVERHAHAYRVGYYEQQSYPGIDATIYVPTVDFKFKNDTKNYILIQSFLDPTNMSLTFTFYGTSDGRKVDLTTPVVTNIIPPPEPLYQDDPTLAPGEIRQVEHAAAGANISFSRTVTRNGETMISETFKTRYVPWRAVYLRGPQT